MSKKVLVVASSFRKGGNSDLLADEFIKGAMEAGNNVEKLYLSDLHMEFCHGCLACQHTGTCIIKDDVYRALKKMREVDVVVFATPIYYYEMSGQMKTFLDRTNPLFSTKYNFKEIYLLMTAADTDEKSIEGAKKGMEGWIECFSQTRLAGTIFAGGVTEKGDILALQDKLIKSYEMGKMC